MRQIGPASRKSILQVFLHSSATKLDGLRIGRLGIEHDVSVCQLKPMEVDEECQEMSEAEETFQDWE